MRLGEFLLMRGKVTRPEIDAACRMQQINNHLIGVLAVDHGMMTCDQLESVLLKQAREEPGAPFGEIAVGLGYLSPNQVQRLLALQDENRLRIGEILVLQSRLTEQELIAELAEYRQTLAQMDEADRKTA
jgi:hypothetical protein